MATIGHFPAEGDTRFEANVSRQSGHSVNMSKIMALSIIAYMAVPILIFLAADRAFESNWPGVAGFLLEAAACALVGKMITWASRNL